MSVSDRGPDPEWPVRPKRAVNERDTTVVATGRKRGINPIYLALGGLIILLLGFWLLSGNRSADQDKLTGSESASSTNGASDPAKACATQSTYDSIKRELFRRAAQLRGSDQAAFASLAGYATLRMENPVLENPDADNGVLNCSGTLSLDLPPGVAVVGGRTSLTSDVDYRIQRAADDSGNVVTLGNADAIVTPLATLAKTQQPPAVTAVTNEMQPTVEVAPQTEGQPSVVMAPSAPAPASQPRPVGARPSFDCANARTRGEVAVCSNAGLAALDRTMAGQFSNAMSRATPEQRDALEQTRDRFLRYRDRCPNNACIGDAYTGRMREIRDIMEGNWRPN